MKERYDEESIASFGLAYKRYWQCKCGNLNASKRRINFVH
ncbi:hypothetical protein VCRA2123O13_160104 [Vibrio crassostreae]|nr:hypothetical protein VCRA2114E5_90022 [Vibrio crassostreae]CAK3176660.1 hypothetical protein VCRA2120E330_120002 [Vibrio crassostreae]CAK3344721.1 hypothetical protein VCRA2123O13_160104 [Vibrio crassostreae]CAK3642384.1 hypothetical protein VCRA2121O337_110002 [Vibrio crassostreae]CAK3657651.1 hypothetical protein VCRA2121O335_110128 [Vibrio crassostreae]